MDFNSRGFRLNKRSALVLAMRGRKKASLIQELNAVVTTVKYLKKISLASLLALLVGCSISPTSLSCGVDGDESYVTMENLKDNSPQTIRTYAEICGFAFQNQEQQ